MSRRGTWITAGLVVVALVAAVLGWLRWQEAQVVSQRERDAARQRAAEERVAAQWAQTRTESQSLMPDLLGGVALGMTAQELRTARPAIHPGRHQGPDEPGLTPLEEDLENGARVVYSLRRATDRLERVQILSLLPNTGAIAPHLSAMSARYGPPTGIWNCPDTGGVPTRRFTWRHEHATLSDVFLVYGGHVSLTLYVAPTNIIGLSLRRASCAPAAPDQLDVFPVASAQQMAGPTSR